jgi:hypothetical protein
VRSDEDVAARVRAVIRDLARDLCEPEAGVQQAWDFVVEIACALQLPPDALAPRPANDTA